MSKKLVSRREFLTNMAAGALVMSSLALVAADNNGKKVKSRRSQGNLFFKKGNPLLVEVDGSNAEVMLLAGLEALG